jgi:hypothetical protein
MPDALMYRNYEMHKQSRCKATPETEMRDLMKIKDFSIHALSSRSSKVTLVYAGYTEELLDIHSDIINSI